MNGPGAGGYGLPTFVVILYKLEWNIMEPNAVSDANDEVRASNAGKYEDLHEELERRAKEASIPGW